MTPIGICFVSEEDWPEYCRISTNIPAGADYQIWLNATERFCAGVAAKGARAVKVNLKPADLLAWCRNRGLEVNSSSRSHYAAMRVAELNKE